MNKLYLCSFSSTDLKRSKERFTNQAEKMNFYENIKIYDENDLTSEIKNQIKNFNYLNQRRLYGFGCWKAFIIKDFLNSVPKNSVVQYSDIGCHLNYKGKERLIEYARICKKQNILGFQYFNPGPEFDNRYKYQNYLEKNYTKKKLFEYFNIENKFEILDSPQFMSGVIFFLNNEISVNFLNEWEQLSLINDLIDNSSCENNDVLLKEHRHDQSLFSILCKINNIKGLSSSECEWAEFQNKRTWEHLENYPILAKRDKEYNLLKRFLDRQKKNISRFINRIK